jgi:hypothetical protein
MDNLHDPIEPTDTIDTIPRRRGRPATGQNTKVIRVPADFDRAVAIKMFYDWMPIISEYADYAALNKYSPRYDRLVKLLEELGEL